MAIVTLPLPAQIADGQVIDAVPVMLDLNYIANQVNANAAPLLTASVSEWTPLGQAPTYISATSYSVPGNLTGTLLPDLRQWSVNTGGNVYSSILTSTFGGGITTVTVANDSGVLDTGLSAINISIQNPVNLSQPQRSAVMVTMANGTSLAASTTYILGENLTPTVQFDLLSEFNTATGLFTAKQKGIYRIYVNFLFAIGAFNSTSASTMSILVNGSIVDTFTLASGATGGTGFIYAWTLETIASLALGGTLQAKAVTGTFTGGPPVGTVANLATAPTIIIQRVA